MGNPSRSASATTYREKIEAGISSAADVKPDPVKVRADIHLSEAVKVELSMIMRTTVPDLEADPKAVKMQLAGAAEGHVTVDEFEQLVYDRMVRIYHSTDGHAKWYRENILASH